MRQRLMIAMFVVAMVDGLGNLNGFIVPEIIKKKLPLTVVTDEKDADFILTGGSVKAMFN